MRLKPPRSIMVRLFWGIGLVCIALGSIILTNNMPTVLGQTSENAQTVQQAQPAEEINPQYEYNVKAAFLYSFGRYVIWPADAFADQSSPFVLGVCGEDPFGQVLDRIAEVKMIQGRRIVIQKMASVEVLKPCHILFVSRSIPPEQQVKIIQQLNSKPILLVGEVPGFTEQGGGINFFLQGGTVQFEINVDAIRQEGLMLDAKLMSLGKKASDMITK